MRHITDGELCERKVMEFEQFSVPPRFPLRVSHITGVEGAKSDILSFATKRARDAFLANQPGNLSSPIWLNSLEQNKFAVVIGSKPKQ